MSKIKNTGKHIVFLLVFSMILSSFSFVFANSFSDIENHWAKNEIKSLTEKGLIEGYSDGTFRPNNDITRAEFMTLINRALVYIEEDTISFSDVSPDDWFYSEVAKAGAAGYISGYPDGTIRPNNPISRQEVAVVMARVLGLKEDTEIAEEFVDYDEIPAWSRGYVGAVLAAGIMEGYPDGTFKAEDFIKRAEAAIALGKINVVIYDEPGTYGPSEGIETIDKNVIIKADGVILQNVHIKGDLTLGEEIGDGNVTLENVTVEGDTFIYGGGKDSIIFRDCILEGTVVVKKSGSQVRIVAEGSTSVPKVVLQSGAILFCEDDGSFSRVELPKDLAEDAEIVLIGNFDEVEVAAEGVSIKVGEGSKLENLVLTEDADGAKIDLDKGAGIDTVKADAKVEITGEGSIGKAEINVSGVIIEQKPDKVDLKPGVEANVGGKDVSEAEKPKDSGGSGGTGGPSVPEEPEEPTEKKVSAISVEGAVKVGETLTATPTPSGATVSYQWMRSDAEDGTYANISGETNKTYKLTEADEGKYIKVEAKGTGSYTGTKISDAVGPVGHSQNLYGAEFSQISTLFLFYFRHS